MWHRPGYSAVAVDVRTNEVILQDNNLWSYRVFNRMDNTPAAARFTEPKRIVQGDKTELQFNNGLYVDPKTSEIYSVESDTGDKMVVFSNDSKGNVPPKRILHTAHRIYNLAVDEEKEELFATIEFPSEVMVYDKHMGGEDLPIRRRHDQRARVLRVKDVASIVFDVDRPHRMLQLGLRHLGVSFRAGPPGGCAA